jgi:casein kinase II subunit alpha
LQAWIAHTNPAGTDEDGNPQTKPQQQGQEQQLARKRETNAGFLSYLVHPRIAGSLACLVLFLLLSVTVLRNPAIPDPPPPSSGVPSTTTPESTPGVPQISPPKPSKSPKMALNNSAGAASIARVYADVNANMPRTYWDYDSVNISWGVLENYEVVRKIGMYTCRLDVTSFRHV